MSATVITYDLRMGRWQPDARGRLTHAAMDLYAERGFDQTTVAEIAERAGLTERTFFRYFTDKREVLFAGASMLQEALVAALAAAPSSAAPLAQVAAAVHGADEFFTDRDFSRQRQAIIATHADLRERELNKMASLSAAFATALRERGVSEPTASLSAEAGIAVFKVSFERWIDEGNQSSFGALVDESFDALRSAAAAR